MLPSRGSIGCDAERQLAQPLPPLRFREPASSAAATTAPDRLRPARQWTNTGGACSTSRVSSSTARANRERSSPGPSCSGNTSTRCTPSDSADRPTSLPIRLRIDQMDSRRIISASSASRQSPIAISSVIQSTGDVLKRRTTDWMELFPGHKYPDKHASSDAAYQPKIANARSEWRFHLTPSQPTSRKPGQKSITAPGLHFPVFPLVPAPLLLVFRWLLAMGLAVLVLVLCRSPRLHAQRPVGTRPRA